MRSWQDNRGTITSWNEGARRLFGYGAEEIIGKSILTLVPDDRRDEETDILGRLQRGEHIQHYETIGGARMAALSGCH